MIIILIRASSFEQLDATVPKYMVREIGSNAHFGYMLAVHSVTMLIGVFFFTMLTFRYSSYTLIFVGALIGAISTSFLIIDCNYFLLVVFIVLLSIGESIWVPRLLDYTLKVAPES